MKDKPLKSPKTFGKVFCTVLASLTLGFPALADTAPVVLGGYLVASDTTAAVSVTCTKGKAAVFYELYPKSGEWDYSSYDGNYGDGELTHNWTISGLTAGTHYSAAFQCVTADHFAAVGIEPYDFWTAGDQLNITRITVKGNAYGVATFSWVSALDAYGEQTATSDAILWYGKSALQNATFGPTTSGVHSVSLELESGQTYWYKACSTALQDGELLSGCSDSYQFTMNAWNPPAGGGGGGSWGDATADLVTPTCKIIRFVDTDATGDGMSCAVQWAGWLVLPSQYSWDKMYALYDTIKYKRPLSYVWNIFDGFLKILSTPADSCPSWLAWQGNGQFDDASIDLCDRLDTVSTYVNQSWWQTISVAAVAFGTVIATVALIMTAI